MVESTSNEKMQMFEDPAIMSQSMSSQNNGGTSSMGIPNRRAQQNNGMRVRKLNKQPTLPKDFEGNSTLTDTQKNAFSKESLLRPVIQPPGTKPNKNRLVPVAPPTMEEIERIQAEKMMEETKEQKPGKQQRILTAGSLNSCTTNSSTPSMEKQAMSKPATFTDSSIDMPPPQDCQESRMSQSNSSTMSRPMSAASQALLFDPNEIVDDNSLVADIVRQNITLLQRCLKSKSKAVFFAAIENVKMASDNFGPALNKHLPIILALVKKRQDLAAKDRLASFKQTLLTNGGNEAKVMIASAQLNW